MTTAFKPMEKRGKMVDTCPNNKTFSVFLVAIIFGWVLIHLWTTAIDNILYRGLGLSQSSWLHTLAVAVVGTLLFLLYVGCVEEKGAIRTKMTGVLVDASLSIAEE